MTERKRPLLKHTENLLNNMWGNDGPDGTLADGTPNKVVRAHLREQWLDESGRFDALLVNGEGTIPEDLPDGSVGGLEPGIYRWVRVYRGDDLLKAIGTFYLTYEVDTPDVLIEMWLSRVRKGLPPNPADRQSTGFNFIPEHVKYNRELTENVNELARESDREMRRFIADEMGSQGVKGLRATTLVKYEYRDDRDHVWVLDGYRVRSTKLAEVLHRLRAAGVQRVPVSMIRKAVSAL